MRAHFKTILTAWRRLTCRLITALRWWRATPSSATASQESTSHRGVKSQQKHYRPDEDDLKQLSQCLRHHFRLQIWGPLQPTDLGKRVDQC
jgi:hypothetical protein